MKISIAMTTFNGRKYVRGQLESIAAQSCLPDELVVCDDCSTDDTTQIVRRFSDRVPFEVRLYENKKNLGLTRNFENALTLCSGDLVFLSDQDDVWAENKIEKVCQVRESTNAQVLINDQIITDSRLQSTGLTKLGNIHKLSLADDRYIPGCATAIVRPLLQVMLPIPVDAFCYDGWINGIASLLRVRTVIDEPLQYYRRHDDNASDFIASRGEKLSIQHSFRSFVARDGLDGLANRLLQLRLYLDRLSERSSELEAVGLGLACQQAIDTCTHRMSAIESRMRLVARPRWSRLVMVAGYGLSGGYRNFSGWRSAMKDLIRP